MLYVVTGPPAAGKSSWIRARAKPSDVVIDFDLLALALAGPGAPDHDHHPTLIKVVHKARYAAINEACEHLDTTDVYLIHTMPSAKARARYTRLGARIVVVDPGRDLVMQRVRDMRQPGMAAVATRWYNQHAASPRQARTSQASRPW